MKKQIILLGLYTTLSGFSFGQTWLTNGSTTYNNPLSNNIGIGTNSAAAPLHLYTPNNSSYSLFMEQNSTTGYGLGITVRVKNNNTKAFHLENYAGSSIIESFKVMGDGRILIGLTNSTPSGLLHLYTPNSTGYNLFIEQNTTTSGGIGQTVRVKSNSTKAIHVENAVNAIQDVFRVMGDGTVYATSINVMPASSFPDYVFSKDYKLMPLYSLECFIKNNHHLPNVPSAKEVETSGMNLGELVKIQMEKIEELTLYVIELKKEIEKLKKDSEVLDSK